METRGFDRRKLLASAAALAGGTVAINLGETGCSNTAHAGSTAGTSIVASDRNAIVETTAGKVRGFTKDGIHTFKGIPYAAGTAGPARFLPPAKPQPWTGIRSSMWYGPTCPQSPRTGWQNDENAFLFQW